VTADDDFDVYKSPKAMKIESEAFHDGSGLEAN